MIDLPKGIEMKIEKPDGEKVTIPMIKELKQPANLTEVWLEIMAQIMTAENAWIHDFLGKFHICKEETYYGTQYAIFTEDGRSYTDSIRYTDAHDKDFNSFRSIMKNLVTVVKNDYVRKLPRMDRIMRYGV